MSVRWVIETPAGPLRIEGDADGVTAITFAPDAAPDLGQPPAALAPAAEQLRDYFAGARRAFDLRLAPRGTDFQRLVWASLQTVPFGHTTTYAALAEALGRPTATRAVGAANGQNPWAVVVPCHRVVGANGHLTGYAGGVAIKRWLLDHEGRLAGTRIG
ncbi:MAG: methylated-DNA--[protein]-cysteine S-methyltransferase [Myxococcales bacterium]|nr:methylated-DNA--[protein]-cysteine S-methyltransferase [Myxococcales bacterium]